MKKTIKNALLTTAGAASILAGASISANASTVKSIKGDTVWDFAQKNHTTVDAIVQANHLSNANLIYVDQSLIIPDDSDTNTASQGSQASQAAPTATSAASATSATSASSADANGDYTVAAGDTLNAIASKTGKSVSDLASLNGISNVNVLMVGQVLHTTGTASAASQAPASQASQASQAPASQATSVASQASQASQAPASQASQASQAPASTTPAPTQTATTAFGDAQAAGTAGFYSGVQGYPAGQCTAFVAGILQAQGVPSSEWTFLGNGNAWGANAAARGVAVNGTPSAGSVAFFGYMHVAYVTGVNGNGTVNIIEGNFNGQAFNARTISAGEASGYIHF